MNSAGIAGPPATANALFTGLHIAFSNTLMKTQGPHAGNFAAEKNLTKTCTQQN